MIIKALVLSERADEYTGKKGLVKQYLLNLADFSDGCRLVQNLEYSMSDDEKREYAGKIEGKQILIGITEIIPFGGRLRVRGSIRKS